MKVREIPLEKLFIKKNVRFDTDDELGEQMASMLKYGQLQPAGVVQRGERYEIVWGHRRFRAAQMNNEPTLSCSILEGISEADIPLIKLQENTVRRQLTNAEILAAVDEIRKARPELSDRHIDVMLGKRPGWIGFRRSIATAVTYAEGLGLSREKLNAMSDNEIIDLRASLTSKGTPRSSKGAFHRPGVPESGFRISSSKGPTVVIVCCNSAMKLRVLHGLRRLQKEVLA